jgi:hypothetical protein
METTLASDADVLNAIERFCAEHEVSPTTFGRLSIGDGSLVTNLRANRSLTLKTANRILNFMASYGPQANAA